MSEDEGRKTPVLAGVRGVQLGTIEDIWRFAQYIANSDFASDDYRRKPYNAFAAIEMGLELGLRPMQALQNIAVISGKPAVYGDAALAIALGSDLVEEFEEWFEGEPFQDDFTAFCKVKRRGHKPAIRTFSVADAKQAGLWAKRAGNGKPTPWVTYPKRMLQMRARAWGLRDTVPDALKGLSVREEVEFIDIEAHEVKDPGVPLEPRAPAKTDERLVEQVDIEAIEDFAGVSSAEDEDTDE